MFQGHLFSLFHLFSMIVSGVACFFSSFFSSFKNSWCLLIVKWCLLLVPSLYSTRSLHHHHHHHRNNPQPNIAYTYYHMPYTAILMISIGSIQSAFFLQHHSCIDIHKFTSLRFVHFRIASSFLPLKKISISLIVQLCILCLSLSIAIGDIDIP